MSEPTATVISVAELRRKMAAIEADRAAEALARQRQLQEEEQHKREMFLHERLDITDRMPGLMARIEKAAAAGQGELLVGTFPSAWLADKGRAINSGDPSWPATLTGVARQFYDAYRRELEPKGFRIRCQIISFPDGMLGDVGVYLDW
ncbi:MAG: hypothetical protein U1E14_19090 [Geminicoccaceae bacterium]